MISKFCGSRSRAGRSHPRRRPATRRCSFPATLAPTCSSPAQSSTPFGLSSTPEALRAWATRPAARRAAKALLNPLPFRAARSPGGPKAQRASPAILRIALLALGPKHCPVSASLRLCRPTFPRAFGKSCSNTTACLNDFPFKAWLAGFGTFSVSRPRQFLPNWLTANRQNMPSLAGGRLSSFDCARAARAPRPVDGQNFVLLQLGQPKTSHRMELPCAGGGRLIRQKEPQ